MLQYLAEWWNYFVEVADTPAGQVQRTFGYFVWALTFWAMYIAGAARRWRFRYVYLSMALHMTLVLVYSALLSLSIDISGGEFSAAVSVATGLALAAGLHAWFISKDMV